MANKFVKLEERLARHLQRANTSGRWLAGRIILQDGDDVDGAIAAEQKRLAAFHAPIVRGDQIHVTARVVVTPPDYDEWDRPIPGTGSPMSTAGAVRH